MPEITEKEIVKNKKQNKIIAFLQNPLSLLKFLKTIFFSFLAILCTCAILYGVMFVVAIIIYILTGNDAILKFMSEILQRIISLKNYFN